MVGIHPRPALSGVLLLAAGMVGNARAEFLDFDAGTTDIPDYAALPRLRLAVDLGGGYLLSNLDTSLSSAAKSYQRSLNLGLAPGAEIAFFAWPKGGLGVSYFSFRSHAENPSLRVWDDEPTVAVEDVITMHYLGISFLTRSMLSAHGMVLAEVGVGKLWYRNDWKWDGGTHVTEAETYGFHVVLGWDRHIAGPFAFGVNGRFIYGSTKKITQDGEVYEATNPDNQYMIFDYTLHRIEVTAGLRLLL